MTEQERCEFEIREMEGLLRVGHPDIEGLLMALADWRTERRLVIAENASVGMPCADKQLESE